MAMLLSVLFTLQSKVDGTLVLRGTVPSIVRFSDERHSVGSGGIVLSSRFRRAFSWIIACVAVTILTSGVVLWRGSSAAVERPAKAENAENAPDPNGPLRWYTPREADFRPEYERDAVNRKVQTWDQYWGWVVSMYSGNAYSAGWTDLAKEGLATVRNRETQQDLATVLNDLGKDICNDWAKDNGVRKIATSDLRHWYGVMADACGGEDGSGARLKAALLEIRYEVSRKLREERKTSTLGSWLNVLRPKPAEPRRETGAVPPSGP